MTPTALTLYPYLIDRSCWVFDVSAHQNHRIRGAGGGSLVAVSASSRAAVGLA